MKSGTTTLANILAQHPSVFLSGVKEPNHFCIDMNSDKREQFKKHSFDAINVGSLLNRNNKGRKHIAVIRSRNDYLSIYRAGLGYLIRGDCSTSYLLSKLAAHEIKDFSPEARIVIILRNPISRAISEFRMRSMIGSAGRSFHQELCTEIKEIDLNTPIYHGCRTYIRAGMYAEQIKRYLDLFGRERTLILIFERFFENIECYVKQIYNHLDIDVYNANLYEKSNVGLLPRSRTLGNILYRMNGNYLIGKYGSTLSLPIKQILKAAWFKADTNQYNREKDFLSGIFAREISRVKDILNDEIVEWDL